MYNVVSSKDVTFHGRGILYSPLRPYAALELALEMVAFYQDQTILIVRISDGQTVFTKPTIGRVEV
jgi:hypothetical protein